LTQTALGELTALPQLYLGGLLLKGGEAEEWKVGRREEGEGGEGMEGDRPLP